MNYKNPQSKIFALAVLSVSVMITTGTAISSALPEMAKSFPKVPMEQIDSIATIQQFAVIITLLLSGIISRKIGIKKTILIGLAATGIAGVFPFFSQNWVLILISRLILGLGIGLFNSLAITLIDLFYDGSQQSQMLGFRSATEQIGVSLLNVLAGMLVLINWHASFLIYLLAFPLLTFFLKNIPEPPVPKQNKRTKQHINIRVVVLALLLFLIVSCSTAVIVQIPNIVVTDLSGTGTVSSIIISLNTLTGMFMGILFGKIYHFTKRFVLPLGIVLMALGSLIIVISNNVLGVLIGAIICGGSYPLVGSYIFSLVNQIAPAGSETLANSCLLIGANMGSFATPFLLNELKRLSSLTNQAAAFLSIFWILAGLTCLVLIQQLVRIKINHHSITKN
ncbi:MFS transporter [Oenococcus kitaharae]|uniref:MFS transporter n=1 Tax=Oenococcus TaxID=46254 RepID=UPI0021E8AEE8|nr:MFS transporter [Oenococcus kitaharae]MCV3296174.1 MFS transporter [Oenococcus kitaharae]